MDMKFIHYITNLNQNLTKTFETVERYEKSFVKRMDAFNERLKKTGTGGTGTIDPEVLKKLDDRISAADLLATRAARVS